MLSVWQFPVLIVSILMSCTVYSMEAFNLGVRSGDPSSDGVILWTQLNPDVFRSKVQDRVELKLTVARDESLEDIVEQQTTWVTRLRKYTTKVDLAGKLEPDTRYYYQFSYSDSDGDYVSRIGKTRTLPDASSTRPITMAVLSCQDYSTGHFNAHKVLSRRSDDIDLVFFNGDFIYEYAQYDSKHATIRRNNLSLPSSEQSAMIESDFSYLYRHYLSDKHLQSSLADLPFIMIHDDHETADNQFWNRTTGRVDIPGERYKGFTSFERERIVLNARKALYDFTPIRADVNFRTESPQEFIKLYRSFRLGALADFVVTDSRSYRDGSEIDDDDQSKTMLGSDQLSWFSDQLIKSNARWRLWGNQVMFSRFVAFGSHTPIPDQLHNSDQWNGFRHERSLIKSMVEDENMKNLVVLTGDLHTSLISYLKPSGDPDSDENLGIELMTPSVTSPNFKEELGYLGTLESFVSLVGGYLKDQNHHLQHINIDTHGFALITLSENAINWRVYSVPVDEHFDNPQEKLLIHMKYQGGKLHQLNGEEDQDIKGLKMRDEF